MIRKGNTTSVLLCLFLLVATVWDTTAQGIIQSSARAYKDCNERAPCTSSALTISLDLYKDKTITFTDPSGITVTYKRTQTAEAVARRSGSDKTKSWNGMADFRSANIITGRRDNKETFTGSFVVEDHVCNLNYKNGEQAMSCRHRSTYPPKMAPLRPPKEGDRKKNLRSPREEGQTIGIFSNATSSRISSASSVIDVMVVWTKKAECALSGKRRVAASVVLQRAPWRISLNWPLPKQTLHTLSQTLKQNSDWYTAIVIIPTLKVIIIGRTKILLITSRLIPMRCKAREVNMVQMLWQLLLMITDTVVLVGLDLGRIGCFLPRVGIVPQAPILLVMKLDITWDVRTTVVQIMSVIRTRIVATLTAGVIPKDAGEPSWPTLARVMSVTITPPHGAERFNASVAAR